MNAASGRPEPLMEVYHRLYSAYGPQGWWPGDSPFEVIIGAILTQATAWTNVEKAMDNLKTAGILSPEGLRDIPTDELALLIRPSGYFNVKARRLKAFIHHLWDVHDGRLDNMLNTDGPPCGGNCCPSMASARRRRTTFSSTPQASPSSSLTPTLDELSIGWDCTREPAATPNSSVSSTKRYPQTPACSTNTTRCLCVTAKTFAVLRLFASNAVCGRYAASSSLASLLP